MPFQKEPEPLEKWRIPGLEQEIQKMSLEHLGCQKVRKRRNKKQSHNNARMSKGHRRQLEKFSRAKPGRIQQTPTTAPTNPQTKKYPAKTNI